MLKAISEISASSTHSIRTHIYQPLNSFSHTRRDDNYVQFVICVFGADLGYHIAYSKRFMLPIKAFKAVKDIIRQLLLGRDFLHREYGIIHNGTFAPSHIRDELVIGAV